MIYCFIELGLESVYEAVKNMSFSSVVGSLIIVFLLWLLRWLFLFFVKPFAQKKWETIDKVGGMATDLYEMLKKVGEMKHEVNQMSQIVQGFGQRISLIEEKYDVFEEKREAFEDKTKERLTILETELKAIKK